MMYLSFMVFACFSLGLFHVNEAGSFECQTCWGGYGNTKEVALKACNHSIEMVVCDEDKPVCMVHHADHNSFHLISRGCASKDSVEENNRLCKDTTILDGYECTVAMCEEPGCTAELPKSVTRCPTCQSTTSLQDCDQKSKLQTCSPRWLGDTDKMRCSVYEDESGGFFRGCMGPIGYKRLKGSLKQFGVCKGDECVASFRGVFRCPACLSKTSLEDCDSNSQLQHCDPSPDFKMCVVYEESGGHFRRECMDAETYGWFHDGSWIKRVGYCKEDDCVASFKKQDDYW